MATSAPMALRMVPSSCWARFSWMAKISSLTVRSRNAYGPPRAENGRIAMTRQHKRVESILAIARLLASPVSARAALMVDNGDMKDNGKWGLTRPFEVFSSFFGHYENDRLWFLDKRQVTQITLGLTIQPRGTSAASLVSDFLSPPVLAVRSPRSERLTRTTACSIPNPKLDLTRPDDCSGESISRGRPRHHGLPPLDTHPGKRSISTVSSSIYGRNNDTLTEI